MIKLNKFSSYYIISEKEYKKLVSIILNKKYANAYSAFIVVLLKELNGDTEAILRILSTGMKSSKKIFPVALYRFLIKSIKEAVILENYNDFVEDDGFISIVKMTKTSRFQKMSIDRQTIIRTFQKYKVTYKARR